MAIQIQLRQGTTTEHSTFTGAVGEVTVDTTKKALVLHDGVTKGGKPLPTLEYGKIPVDQLPDELLYTPIPYPKSTPPKGYLSMMGQTISKETYPKLYGLYGEVLPDLRAYTIRGWDNGKGIDTGRTLLSEQGDAIRNITGQLGRIASAGVSGDVTKVFKTTGGTLSHGGVSDAPNAMFVDFDASRVVPTATENRVKNIAFNYIVKAG